MELMPVESALLKLKKKCKGMDYFSSSFPLHVRLCKVLDCHPPLPYMILPGLQFICFHVDLTGILNDLRIQRV